MSAYWPPPTNNKHGKSGEPRIWVPVSLIAYLSLPDLEDANNREEILDTTLGMTSGTNAFTLFKQDQFAQKQQVYTLYGVFAEPENLCTWDLLCIRYPRFSVSV